MRCQLRDRNQRISENIYFDFDTYGHLISMTIKHARASAQLKELSFQESAVTENA